MLGSENFGYGYLSPEIMAHEVLLEGDSLSRRVVRGFDREERERTDGSGWQHSWKDRDATEVEMMDCSQGASGVHFVCFFATYEYLRPSIEAFLLRY